MASALLKAFLVTAVFGIVTANAESHTIKFNNQCGKGTPTLIIGGQIVSNGSDYTSSGSAASGIAYLQTGDCLFNGEECALLEFTLGNPMCAGCGSSVDISLIPPHALNVPVAFSYFNGCDGQGAACNTADCSSAFFKSDDNQVQVACQSDNVNLLISFCEDGSSSSPSSKPVTSSSAAPLSPSVSENVAPEPTSSLSPPSASINVPAPSSTEGGASPASSKPPSDIGVAVPLSSGLTSATATPATKNDAQPTSSSASGGTCRSRSNRARSISSGTRSAHRRFNVHRMRA